MIIVEKLCFDSDIMQNLESVCLFYHLQSVIFTAQ